MDEACGILISLAVPDTELRCQIDVTHDKLTFEASVTTDRAARPPSDYSFAFQVIETLADTVVAEVSEGTASIRLAKRHRDGTQPASDRYPPA